MTGDKIDSRESSLSDFLQVPSEDLFEKANSFQTFLEDGRRRGFEVYLRPIRSYASGRAVVADSEGKNQEVIVMCSADYLGLSRHPRLIQAAQQAAQQYGVTVSSVPLIAGATDTHTMLQQELAQFTGHEAAVLFPTGYAANVGTISALCGHTDAVIVDKGVHYSILEGVRISAAKRYSFRHSDPDHLEEVIQRARQKVGLNHGVLVIVQGVYGLDGDICPLPALMPICKEYGARVMVDNAHAHGVLGHYGKGSGDHLINELNSADVVMGSLSKSLGSLGGWISTTDIVADYLRYYAQTIVMSVGLPAAMAAAALEALHMLKADSTLMDKLRYNIAFFRQGLLGIGITNAERSGSAIFSVPIGCESMLRDVSRDLFLKGIWAEALPFPAVSRGEERIRLRVNATHEIDDLRAVIETLDQVLTQHKAMTGFPSARRV